MEFNLLMKDIDHRFYFHYYEVYYSFKNGSYTRVVKQISNGTNKQGTGRLLDGLSNKNITSVDDVVAQKDSDRDSHSHWGGSRMEISCANDRLYFLEATGDPSWHDDRGLLTATNLKLYKTVAVKVDDPNGLRKEIIEELNKELAEQIESCGENYYGVNRIKESITRFETMSEDNPSISLRPEVMVIDEVTLVFDNRSSDFKVSLQRNGQDLHLLKRGEAYRFSTLLSAGGWFGASRFSEDKEDISKYFAAVANAIDTTSAKRVLAALYQCPAIRQCWLEYGNFNMVRHLLRLGDKESLSIQGSASKVLGISKLSAKLISSIISELNARNISARYEGYINETLALKRAFNDQIAENFLSTLLTSIVEIQVEDVRGDTDTANRYRRIFSDSIDAISTLVLKYGGPKGKNYDVGRLLKYLLYDVDTYQGIDSPKLALDLLADYYRSLDISGLKIKDWFPRSLHLAHDVAAKNARVMAQEYEEAVFRSQTELPNYQRLEYLGNEKNDDDKDKDEKQEPYIVVIPHSPKDLVDEGAQLHHCVGSYVKDVANGSKMICFMRETCDPKTSLVTLEVNPKTNTLVQYRGSCNRSLSKEELTWLKKWCRMKHLSIVSC